MTISHRTRATLVCYALLLPTLAMLVVFVFTPVIWAFSRSLFEFEIGADSRFVGMDNYREFLSRDPTFLPSIANMLFLTSFAVFVQLTVPLIVAKLIHSLPRERWRYIYRLIFLIPTLVPGVAVMLIWQGMIYSDRGMLNEFLRGIGLASWATGWLANPRTALYAVAMIGFPFVGGFQVLIYYAGLSAIPESVNEAAAIEGCTGVGKFFRIDLPMVMSQLKLILILTIIMGVQSFQHLLILTEGGPGFRTMVPGLWMYYNAFSFQRMGYACSIGVFLFAIVLGLTILNIKYFRSTEQLQETT